MVPGAWDQRYDDQYTSCFQESTGKLSKSVGMERDIKGYLYDGMVHSTSAPELRDLLGWLNKDVSA
jgi:hypothetical protein